MVVNNPNNWHWVDKNCLTWSKEYFEENLLGLDAQDETSNVHIVDVSSVEGDVDVSQRKGKVISLFDLKIVLSFHGYNEKDDDISGSITIPELAYDSEESDLVFEISVYNESSENTGITTLIKQKLVPQLKSKLLKFGPDLIETNVRDIQIEKDKVTSTYTKGNLSQAPAPAQQPQQKKEAPKPVAKPTTTVPKKEESKTSGTSKIPKYNTTTLHLEPSFNTSAEQIYITLLDESRIAAWTRSYPIIEKFPPKEGSTFKFFGGAVQGKFLKLVRNEQIVELWRLQDWKEGHYAELDMKLVQSSGETKLVVKFSGIPIGEEERVKDNFEDMYIRSIKITFGFGAVL
ncbi:AHA1 [Candida jiufengensis]|uniref:AHA1 n=1 Tax=Candida jiufengensis TaxID=497108 RepID=UPI002225A814|nr:AHA1 [Candida jiufengensis]KAI5957319.1 AHA1 [Candida jiufengensis]